MLRDVNFACRINPAAQSGSLGFNVCANCCRMVDSVPRWQLSLYNTVRPSDDCRSDKGQNLVEECNCPPALGSNGPKIYEARRTAVLWSIVLQPQYVKKFNPISDANKANNGGSWNFGGSGGGWMVV